MRFQVYAFGQIFEVKMKFYSGVNFATSSLSKSCETEVTIPSFTPSKLFVSWSFVKYKCNFPLS